MTNTTLLSAERKDNYGNQINTGGYLKNNIANSKRQFKRKSAKCISMKWVSVAAGDSTWSELTITLNVNVFDPFRTLT